MVMQENMHQILTDRLGLAGDTLVWLLKEKRAWYYGVYFTVLKL
jgi:hypothetical protein